ncbi:MAG: PRC-barrel domain-containing protein [Promethearchaeota archaeon]
MIEIESSPIDIRNLIGIPVQDEKGSTMGKVVDFIINSRDGRLVAVCIKPTKNPLIEKFPRDEKGIVLIPLFVIKSINTSLTIAERKVRVFLIKQKLQEDKNHTTLFTAVESTNDEI